MPQQFDPCSFLSTTEQFKRLAVRQLSA